MTTPRVAPPPPNRYTAPEPPEQGPRARRWHPVVAPLPGLRDPRLPFAAILTLYLVMGVAWLGFNRTPGQILAIVAIGCSLEMVLHWVLRRREVILPLSAYISCLSLAILLNYSHDYALLAVPVFLTIGSKYLITVDGRHHYNPSLFGVVVSLLVAGHLITTAPAYQWGGTLAMSAFIVMLAFAGFLFRVGRGWLIASFLLTYVLQTALRAWIMRAHLPPEMLFLGTLSSPPFFVFTFFMITDPRTSPDSRRAQIGVGVSIALVDLVLHKFGSVFTFFYAAFIVATARFLWLHARRAHREGVLHHLRWSLLSRDVLRAAAVLGAIALTGAWSYAHVIRPRVAITDPGFRLRVVPAAVSGLAITMDPSSYDLVDPRLRHIAKWLLSVGSSAETADVDGDGRPDVLLTSPLAIPGDRVVLWLNRGGMRFERAAVPAFAQFVGAPAEHGLASGALFVDYDNDGDQDLLVLVSFGAPRLLRNMLVETGALRLEDVSEQAGMPRYAVSIAANVIDYDRDGRPDILIGNVLSPVLHSYADSTPLNIFRLPPPAYPGDRRMFAFMHDGWHDANNGGRNILLHNVGGRFEIVDAAAMGMPETHWTMAIGTGDFNGDGWTDLYLASDFGRDDLYINEGGRHFRRVAGRMFGDIGMDTYKGMNSSVADFDRDGRLDVYVSNVHHALQAEGSLLWMNDGADALGTPAFHDDATRRGALNEDRFGWGAGAGDLDNDGWTDLVQANGMVDDRLDRRADGCPDYWYVNHKLMQAPREMHMYADMWGDLRGRCIYPNEARRVYMNRGALGHAEFTDVAAAVRLTGRDNSRGVALADFDDDGRLDVLIANQHGGPTLLHNERVPAGQAGNAWLGLTLVGDGRSCARDATGSRVAVTLPGQAPLVREAQRLNGLSAANDPRIHFGLGRWTGDVPVSVRWCGGATSTYRLAAGAYHTVRQ